MSHETLYKCLYVQEPRAAAADLHKQIVDQAGRAHDPAGRPNGAASTTTCSPSASGPPRPPTEPYPATGKAT